MLTTCRSINDLINTGESKRISRTRLVQIRVLHTHPLGAVLLEDKHWVSFNTLVRHQKNQELAGRHSKNTLRRVKHHLVNPKIIKGLL